MSDLSPERREELTRALADCDPLALANADAEWARAIIANALAPLIAKWLDLTELLATEGSYAEGCEAGAAEVRARCEAIAAEWERDNEEHLNTWGQHLPATVGQMADILRAALNGDSDA